MEDHDRLAVTLQYSINHARNCRLKTTTIFISTLSECLTVLKELEDMKKEQEAVPLEKIPGLTIGRCGSCRGIITNDMKYCPKCGRMVKRDA